MTSGEIRRIIEAQAQILGPGLHAGVATSLAGASPRAKGLASIKYPHLLPLIMRAEMREFLESNPLGNGWAVGGDSRRMGQLLLENAEHNLELRFLKERRRGYPNGVPAAGSNKARRAVWAQPPLDFPVPLTESVEAGPVRLLLLWDFASPTDLDQFSLRIVHTVAAGTYGKAVPCDLILDVNDGGEIFKRLEFTGSSDDDHDFFVVEVDHEENESGA